jgi:hypothetical protein
MHDPSVQYSSNDVMDPILRVKMFERMGVLQVGDPAFPYRQPALSSKESSVPFLLGLVRSSKSWSRPFLDAHILRRFLVAYWRDCCYPEDPRESPDYVEMMRHLPLHSRIPLVPFSCVNKRKPRVLIVGAGISGLSCAELLYSSGLFELEIWEARNRCGGRVDPRSVNLGPSWLHGLTSLNEHDVRSHRTWCSSAKRENFNRISHYHENLAQITRISLRSLNCT